MLRNKKDKKQFDKELGKKVKYYRDLRGLTLANLNDITGYSGAYINYIEKAANTPSSYVVWLLSQAFGIPIGKLFPNTNKVKSFDNSNDPILQEEDFKPYLELAKEAYLKKIDSKILDRSIKILSEK